MTLSLAAACASAPSRSKAAAARPAPAPAPDPTISLASEEFVLGRDAALSGDFECARGHFDRAFDLVQPAGSPPLAGERLEFALDLYEGIQRYEALAGATEEAGTSHGQVAPELAEIETPSATPEEISTAREAVASDMPVADVPIVFNDAVLRIIAAFQSDLLHDKIAAGLSRSGRYLPLIHRIFAEEGLPQDLAMIAFIESSFLPHARSPRMAHGIWQFMPRTGRQYGLKSNGIVDERSDPQKATRAAARYIKYLHEIFGDWYLVMAAYNAGEGKILRAMQRTGATDFWQLASTSAIRRQTQNYVPAFLASVLISKNPEHYGFQFEPEPPLEYDTLWLERPVNLQELARGTDTSVEELAALNPELRSAITPREPEGYELRIPVGRREAFGLAYAAAPTANPPDFRSYVARKGETLPRIARRYGVSVSSLATANSLSPRTRLARGQEIMIPQKVAPVSAASKKRSRRSTASPARTAPAVVAVASPSSKSYRVRNGDTLYRIALRHGTTVAEILAINSLGRTPSIKPGDKLKIPAKK